MIQGTWLIKVDNGIGESGYEFKTDDFLQISSFMSYSFKEQLQIANSPNINTVVVEKITDNIYELEITFAVQTLKFYFEKISENVIEWTNDGYGDLLESLYIKQ